VTISAKNGSWRATALISERASLIVAVGCGSAGGCYDR